MDVTKTHQEGSKAVLIKVGVVVVALAAIAGGYLLSRPGQPSYTVTQAAKGEVVAGFPNGLIVEKDAVIENSYSLAYPDGNLNQPVVTYASNWPMVQNVVQFGSYLKANGWAITHVANPMAQTTFYYADKDNASVNITLATEAGKVKVTISYITR